MEEKLPLVKCTNSQNIQYHSNLVFLACAGGRIQDNILFQLRKIGSTTMQEIWEKKSLKQSFGICNFLFWRLNMSNHCSWESQWAQTVRLQKSSCNPPILGKTSRTSILFPLLQNTFLTSFLGFINMQRYELKHKQTLQKIYYFFWAMATNLRALSMSQDLGLC